MRTSPYLGIVFALLVGVILNRECAIAQSEPEAPERYKRFFVQYATQGPWYERALNSIGFTTLHVGRSYALVAGVTQYPNFPKIERSLRPAEVDLEKLTSYLRTQEHFDEIVELKDGDFTLENLNYFLENYFPKQIKASPHARFLFAYSGHGYAEENRGTTRGFLLMGSATSRSDPENRIDLEVVRTLLSPVIESAEKVLVLINSCRSGAFLGRRSFGSNPLTPGLRGAHAILASRASESSLHQDNVGPGSVFFEKIFAGLGGVADTAPRDGIVTYHELDNYLLGEIPLVTAGKQTPVDGDISRDGSEGEFFFLNRGRQVQLGNVEAWDPGSILKFGMQAADDLEEGRALYLAGKWDVAVEAFKRAAAAGSSDAMNCLGDLYDSGQGVKQDYGQAREWFKKAATAGNAEGMDNLGYLYAEGRGVKQDYQEALRWYEEAASASSASAMDNLGYLYAKGLGVKQDYSQAREWYEKGAVAGSAEAMYNLGSLYDKAQGVEQDYQQAWHWYLKAAKAGSADAMNNLGYMYSQGRGVPRDYRRAQQWYERGASAGNAEAENNLGFLYDKGQGVRRDYRKAFQWYQRAAEAGNADGMNNLGHLFEHGNGVKQDYRQSSQWYEKAAAAGSARAMYHLGYLYERGRGVKQDREQARQFYHKAAGAGDKDATKRLKVLHR